MLFRSEIIASFEINCRCKYFSFVSNFELTFIKINFTYIQTDRNNTDIGTRQTSVIFFGKAKVIRSHNLNHGISASKLKWGQAQCKMISHRNNDAFILCLYW